VHLDLISGMRTQALIGMVFPSCQDISEVRQMMAICGLSLKVDLCP